MLEQKYKEEIIPSWLKQKEYTSPLAVPRVDKVVLNIGVGEAKEKPEAIKEAQQQLGIIAGQTPEVRKSKKAIAAFGLRANTPIGVRVTLRGKKMYQFLEKLFNLVLPRTRDFRGLSQQGFDGRGNYSLGLEEQIIFLEIDPNKTKKSRGLQITIVTSAQTDEEGEKLLLDLGAPLQKEES